MDSVPTAHSPHPSGPQQRQMTCRWTCTSCANLVQPVWWINCCQIKCLCRVTKRGRIWQCVISRKGLHSRGLKCAKSLQIYRYRRGVMLISRSAAMRSSSGGWVLKSEDSMPPPKKGLTMQSAEVDGESEVVGMRWL